MQNPASFLPSANTAATGHQDPHPGYYSQVMPQQQQYPAGIPSQSLLPPPGGYQAATPSAPPQAEGMPIPHLCPLPYPAAGIPWDPLQQQQAPWPLEYQAASAPPLDLYAAARMLQGALPYQQLVPYALPANRGRSSSPSSGRGHVRRPRSTRRSRSSSSDSSWSSRSRSRTPVRKTKRGRSPRRRPKRAGGRRAVCNRCHQNARINRMVQVSSNVKDQPPKWVCGNTYCTITGPGKYDRLPRCVKNKEKENIMPLQTSNNAGVEMV